MVLEPLSSDIASLQNAGYLLFPDNLFMTKKDEIQFRSLSYPDPYPSVCIPRSGSLVNYSRSGSLLWVLMPVGVCSSERAPCRGDSAARPGSEQRRAGCGVERPQRHSSILPRHPSEPPASPSDTTKLSAYPDPSPGPPAACCPAVQGAAARRLLLLAADCCRELLGPRGGRQQSVSRIRVCLSAASSEMRWAIV